MRSGEEPDFSVAECGEMIHRCANARGVVKQDGAGLGVGQLELGQHNGNIVKRELIQYRFFLAERENRDALYLALKHAAHACGQDRRIAIRGTDQDFVAVRYSNLFESFGSAPGRMDL